MFALTTIDGTLRLRMEIKLPRGESWSPERIAKFFKGVNDLLPKPEQKKEGPESEPLSPKE